MGESELRINLTPREKHLLDGVQEAEQQTLVVRHRSYESKSKLILMGNMLPSLIEVDHGLPTFQDALSQLEQIRTIEKRDQIKVMVIVPPDKQGNLPTANSGAWAPLGPWLVGTWAKQRGAEVKLVDGIITPEDEIAEAIRAYRPDLVGFSVLTSGVEPAIALSKVAKTVGSIVCWGNDHATQNADKTLIRDRNVDVIIRGDGGDKWFGDLVEVLQGKRDINSVLSTSFRVLEGIRNTPFFTYDLSEELIPDPGLISREQHSIYVRNFRKYWGHTFPKEMTPAIINVARGCHWGASRCSYCDIIDLRPQSQNDSQKVWGWARMLVDEYDADLLYDGDSDTFDTTQMSKDATALLAPEVSWDELIDTVNWTYGRCYKREIHPATFTISGEKDEQGRMWLK